MSQKKHDEVCGSDCMKTCIPVCASPLFAESFGTHVNYKNNVLPSAKLLTKQVKNAVEKLGKMLGAMLTMKP